jgi:hypothetical protein
MTDDKENESIPDGSLIKVLTAIAETLQNPNPITILNDVDTISDLITEIREKLKKNPTLSEFLKALL